MNLSPDAINVSYDICRQVARRAGSNFYPCFVGLPRDKRRAMDAVYAFMRHTDDLVDQPRPAEQRQAALVQWRAELKRTLQGQFEYATGPGGRDLLPALTDAIERYAIPPEYFYAVLDGVQMDLDRRRYETFGQLARYCEHVASSVGLACIHVWGFHGRQALEPARKCGIALQLTNILRDLREDARRDRVYLPAEDLRQCGYSADDLVAGVADDRFQRLMEFQIGRAEWFYREGAELMDWLEPCGRRIFGMVMSTYRSILKRIKRRPADVLTRRICLSQPKKLQIAARWMLLPPRVTALL